MNEDNIKKFICCYCEEDIFEHDDYRSSNCGEYEWHVSCRE